MGDPMAQAGMAAMKPGSTIFDRLAAEQQRTHEEIGLLMQKLGPFLSGSPLGVPDSAPQEAPASPFHERLIDQENITRRLHDLWASLTV